MLKDVIGQEKQVDKMKREPIFAQYRWLLKWRIVEFIQDSAGKYSGSRIFALVLVLATIGDWMVAVFNPKQGVWIPDWQQVGLVLGILGYKFSDKMKGK